MNLRIQKIAFLLLVILQGIYGQANAQNCDTLDYEWNNPSPNTVVYTNGGGYLMGIYDPANSLNPLDVKTVYEGFTTPVPGSIPIGAARLGLGLLIDPNDNTTIDVNVYNDASGAPGTLIGGVTGISPTQLGVVSSFKNYWIQMPPGLIPSTSTFYIGVVFHPGDSTDRLVLQTNDFGQGNGDGSNSITTTGYGNEKLLTIWGADIDINIVAKLGVVENPEFNYSSSTYCPIGPNPTPTITGDPGGVFTSTPAGLSMNPATGTINVLGTTPGTYNVTYTTVGTCPQSATKTVTVNDVVPPTITCPGTQLVNYNSSCGFILPNYISMVVASDNCSPVFFSQSPTAGTVITGPQTVTMTASDQSGNITTCTFDVIPSDATPPVITCPLDQYVSFDANCQFALPDYTGMATTTDNCGTVTVTQSPVSGSLLSTTQTVTLTATDGNGNTSLCSFDVIPSDNTPPGLTCPGNQAEVLDVNCAFVLPDYTALVSATDNCAASVLLTQSPVAGTAITAAQTITITADDGNGNTNTCTFDVVLSDTTSPVVVCPPTQNVFFDANCEFILPDYVPAISATDNCTVTGVTQTPSAGTVITGSTTVTMSVTDGAGNSTFCSFDVIPTDTVSPTISCPGDIIVSNDPGQCGAVVNYIAPTGTDNCSGATTIQTSGLPAGSLFPIGTTTNTFEVTDGAGNSSVCSFDVVVTDTENPVITCPSAIFTCDSLISFADPVISDNCTGATFVLTSGLSSGNTFPTGVTTNVYTVTDASGNSSSCSVNITRYVLPTIDAGPDLTIDAGKETNILTTGTNISTYNWSPATGLNDPTIASPIASPTYTTQYTITVTSNDGCVASDEVNVTVNLNIEVNNFMSPNGDGKNDTWIIKGNYLLENCTVQVFDSWGNLLFESTGYANNWDGTRAGEQLPEGNYYYVIRCDEQQIWTGSITLIR